MKKLGSILCILATVVFLSACWETKKKTAKDSTVKDAAEVEVVHPDSKSSTPAASKQTTSALLFEVPAAVPSVLSSVQALAQDKFMEFDLDKDGQKETILLGRDHPNGVRVLATYQGVGRNLINDIDEDIFFDSYGELKAPNAIQVSLVDLDRDGRSELIVTLGKRAVRIDSFIFGLDAQVGFYYINSISSKEPMKLNPDRSLGVIKNGQIKKYQLKNKQLVELN